MTTIHTHRAPSHAGHTPRHVRRRGAHPRTRPSPRATSPQDATPRAHRRRSVLMVVVASLGLGMVLYPSAASWFATLGHNSEISGYAQEVENLPTATTRALLADARAYNAHLPAGQLRDPSDAPPATEDLAAQEATYRTLLDPGSSSVMGRLRYPAIDADLPIYHGTDDEVLSQGVGHLFGSSLPVGGDGTHSILTSHSGMANSKLFTGLLKARVGDQFTVDVLDEHLYYRVDQITTVDPADVASLVIEDGEDYVTLITCTPIGVNTHRLLVRGVRVEGPPSVEQTDGSIAANPPSVDFPSWAVAFVGGSLAFAFVPRLGAGLRTRSDGRRGRHRKDAA